MSDQLPEGVSRQEFSELVSAVRDLTKAQEELASAKSAAERDDAKEEVADARADLNMIAKEMGISPDKLRQAAEQARKEERKEELRPLLKELLDEELADEPTAEAEEEKPEPDEEKKPEPEEETATATEDEPEEEPEDSAPVKQHWSERPIIELFK